MHWASGPYVSTGTTTEKKPVSKAYLAGAKKACDQQVMIFTASHLISTPLPVLYKALKELEEKKSEPGRKLAGYNVENTIRDVQHIINIREAIQGKPRESHKEIILDYYNSKLKDYTFTLFPMPIVLDEHFRKPVPAYLCA